MKTKSQRFTIIAIVLIYALAVGIAMAASKEAYVRVFPANSTLKSNGQAAETTYAMQNSAESDWFDVLEWLKASHCKGFRVTVTQLAATGNSADVDSQHFITRFTDERQAIVVGDSQKVAGAGTGGSLALAYKTKVFSFSDTAATAARRFGQVYMKMAVIDNVDSTRRLKYNCVVQGINADGSLGPTMGGTPQTIVYGEINE